MLAFYIHFRNNLVPFMYILDPFKRRFSPDFISTQVWWYLEGQMFYGVILSVKSLRTTELES